MLRSCRPPNFCKKIAQLVIVIFFTQVLETALFWLLISLSMVTVLVFLFPKEETSIPRKDKRSRKPSNGETNKDTVQKTLASYLQVIYEKVKSQMRFG